MKKIDFLLKPQRLRSKDGMTLVEVLVAVLVLTIALTGTILTFTKSNIFISDIQQYLLALESAQEEVETVRGMAFDNVTALGSTFSHANFSQLNSATGTITLTDPFSDSNIRKVTVVVNWTSSQGRSMQVRVSTNVAREGINKI